jgi:hypothetical protein
MALGTRLNLGPLEGQKWFHEGNTLRIVLGLLNFGLRMNLFYGASESIVFNLPLALLLSRRNKPN